VRLGPEEDAERQQSAQEQHHLQRAPADRPAHRARVGD
jgi:hypothetical protein